MESLIIKYQRLIQSIPTDFRRALYAKINWEARAVCIEGARGSGKSTLMLQYIADKLDIKRALYVSLDDLYFSTHSLPEVAESFYNEGGRHLFMDEVHKYADWQTALKNIYDFFPDLKLVVSGSSILALQNSRADLSRRLLHYHLPELSFREYLQLRHNIELPAISLEELLSAHQDLVPGIIQRLPSPLQYFKEFLTYGAYPFVREGESDYLVRINQLINVIIDYDLPEARSIEISTQSQLKRLLYIISQSVPFTPNITKLAEQTGTTRARLLEMLHLLEQAQLIRNLRSGVKGISLMNKPDKIFLHNNSLIAALAEEKPDKGNMRETFFLSQLQNAGHVVTHPPKSDFLVNNKFLFEIGGKNKNDNQIKTQTNAWIAADDIEFGAKNKIPLWMFGLLY